jgi:site-specific DNA-methyltransferase (adenine-specific)
VPTSGAEKTGYPAQKPLGILRRIIAASSSPGDLVLDFFAGSGTTGQAALELGRRFVLVDSNPEALEVMARRFAGVDHIEWIGYTPKVGRQSGPRRPGARRRTGRRS